MQQNIAKRFAIGESNNESTAYGVEPTTLRSTTKRVASRHMNDKHDEHITVEIRAKIRELWPKRESGIIYASHTFLFFFDEIVLLHTLKSSSALCELGITSDARY